jgi:ubiquitin carboxyl-terminal hydrolase 7
VAEEDAARERRRKEREEAHLYMQVQVASEVNFRAHQGFDLVPSWNVDTNTEPTEAHPTAYKVLKTSTMADFCKTVTEDMGVEPHMVRPWAMVNRQNGTVRPDVAIAYPDMTVEEAASKFGTKTAHFKIWIEKAESCDEEGTPVFGDQLVDLKGQQNNRALMLFLKHFDAKEQTLYGVGNFYAGYQDKVQELGPQILKVMGWPPGTNFKLSEEIKQNMIEAMKPKMTLAQSEIQDGDIITVQRNLSDKE